MYDESVSRSDVDYAAREAARQSYYDAINYFEEQMRTERQERHMALQDLRDGLAELVERVNDMEIEFATELKQLREDHA